MPPKINKSSNNNPLPECPVCIDTMTIPIYQCKSGHSLCYTCTQNLPTPLCPMCRQDMTQVRNWQLEEIISKAKVLCPNSTTGCKYTLQSSELEEHLKECIFRQMDCPLGTVFGKCSWKGQLKELLEHFNERHPGSCNPNPDEELEITVNINEDERYLYLLCQQTKFLFILTVKIDTLQNMAYFAIQHIGAKSVAKQYIYEIHITSKQNEKRKFMYIDHCFNDAIKADEIFRMGKCAMMPLGTLQHFVNNKKMGFRFFIKRMGPPMPKPKANETKELEKPQGDKKNFHKGFKPHGAGPSHTNKAKKSS